VDLQAVADLLAAVVDLTAMVGLQTLATTSIKEAQVATLGTSMLQMAVQLAVKLGEILGVDRVTTTLTKVE